MKMIRRIATFYEKYSDFFFYLGFLSRTFTIHGTAEKDGGHVFNSPLPPPPASQILSHYPGDYYRDLTCAHSWQPDLSREPWFPNASR